MTDNSYVLLIATQDKLPVLDAAVDPIGLSASSPIWVDSSNNYYYICNGVVDSDYLSEVQQIAADNSWTLLSFGASLSLSMIGWQNIPLDSAEQPVDFLYSWGLSPKQPDDL